MVAKLHLEALLELREAKCLIVRLRFELSCLLINILLKRIKALDMLPELFHTDFLFSKSV